MGADTRTANSGAKIRLIMVNLLSWNVHDSEHGSVGLYGAVHAGGGDLRQTYPRATVGETFAHTHVACVWRLPDGKILRYVSSL